MLEQRLSIIGETTVIRARVALKFTAFAILSGLVLSSASRSAVAQSRVLGLDLSAWQGNLSQTTWNNLHNNDDRDFVFIRSSRGGTTGFYNQSDPNNNNNLNTLSQRYDDPYFAQNIRRATNAGLFAGAYHFGRADIISSTQNSGGISNTGADEADHFIEMAGAWMRPGYLLPVFDLEAGQSQRTNNDLAQFSADFGNRIYEVMGIRPAIYTSGNYANSLQGASSAWEDAVTDALPTLWSARWPNGFSPFTHNVQTDHPKDFTSTVYGPWDDSPFPTHPWSFWQYTPVGNLSAYGGNLDLNVAQGGTEFLKDNLIPALWTSSSDGQWTTVANWNSGQTPIAPVQGPGQVPRVGSLILPPTRLPGSNDTVILDRSDGSVTITLDSGTHTIRKLEVREALNITGGSLTVNYVPSADSTPLSAQFSAPVTLDGGSLSVHTLQVDASQTFSLGGTLTFDTIDLMPHSTSPATIDVIGDVNFNPLNGATATIANGAGAGNSGLIDLGGADRALDVSDGAADVDLLIEVPIVNGALTKRGAGKLSLVGANSYSGDTTVEEGILSLGNSTLADLADVYLLTGAGLELDFGGGPDVIDSLFIDGVSQVAGTWGAFGSGAQFTSALLAGSGFLQVSTLVASLPGDYNENGIVDAADYTVWLDNIGGPAGVLPNDTDGGVIGQPQFATWKANFGSSLASAAQDSANVPEPSTFLLLSGLAIMTVLFPSRHRVA